MIPFLVVSLFQFPSISAPLKILDDPLAKRESPVEVNVHIMSHVLLRFGSMVLLG